MLLPRHRINWECRCLVRRRGREQMSSASMSPLTPHQTSHKYSQVLFVLWSPFLTSVPLKLCTYSYPDPTLQPSSVLTFDVKDGLGGKWELNTRCKFCWPGHISSFDHWISLSPGKRCYTVKWSRAAFLYNCSTIITMQKVGMAFFLVMSGETSLKHF